MRQAGTKLATMVAKDNPYAGMTVEEAADSIAITPDVWLCPICGFQTESRDEYVTHMDAEGLY